MTRAAGGGAAALSVLALLLIAPAGPCDGGRGLTAQESGASELSARAGRVEGRATFRVDLREDVEVCEGGVRRGERQGWGRWDRDRGACSRGVGVVEMDVRGGRVEDLELIPWIEDARAPDHDLGPVDPEAALDFLVGLADGGALPARPDAAEGGLVVTGLLRGVEAWPSLLAVARDRRVDRDVRRSALFWVGQAAAERVSTPGVADGLSEVALDGDEDSEVREAAVFALSQRPAGEAVPALIEVVRSVPDHAVRRSALFWLSQHDSPEVLRFFESILSGG